jgi:hypothetical protein
LLSSTTQSLSASSAPCVQAPPQPRLTALRTEWIDRCAASHSGVASLLPLSITRIVSAGVPWSSRLCTHCCV